MQTPVQNDINRHILKSKRKTLIRILAKEFSISKLTSSIFIRSKERGYNMKPSTIKKIIWGIPLGVFLFILLPLFYFVYSPMEKKPTTTVATTEAYVTFTVGTVTIKHEKSEPTVLKNGEAVFQGDTIITGTKSTAIIQFENIGLVKIIQNSEVKVSTLNNEGDIELNIPNSGSLFAKLDKLTKDQRFRVSSPSTVAAVRGTEFLYTYGNKKSELEVRDGRVAIIVTNKENIPETIVEKNQGCRSTENQSSIEQYDLTEKNKLVLDKHALFSYQPNAKTISDAERETLLNQVIEQENIIDKKIESLDKSAPYINPLDRLRAQGKPLTKIYLKDTSEIIGSVVSQNNGVLSFDTGEGIIKIPVTDIVRRMPIK